MKKKLNIISTFLMIITMICGMFALRNNTIKADTTSVAVNQVIQHGAYGKITLTPKGEITIEYTYGFSELLILGIPCEDEINEDVNHRTCTKWSTTGSKIIHLSGEKGKGSKTIHLFSYFTTYDQLVKVSFVYEFASSDNSGFFTPLYCNKDAGTCGDSSDKYDSDNFVYKRIAAFVSKENDDSLKGVSSPTIDYVDRKGLIYKGSSSFSNVNEKIPDTSTLNNVAKTNDNNKAVTTRDLVVKIDNTKMGESGTSEIESMIYDTIIPVMLGVLGLCAVVSATVLGVKIVKSSDEPQERQEKVKALRNILIGLAFAFLALLVTEPLVNFVKGFLE